MKKYLLAPALAALATFIWGFLYWGAPPYLPYQALQRVNDESAMALEVGKLFPASGTYLLPSPLIGSEKMQELGARGPMLEVHITKEGMSNADQAKCMALGFVHMFVVSLLLAIIMGSIKDLDHWTCVVRIATKIGLLVATCDFGNAIWWRHSLGWTCAQAFYDFVTYVVIGLVLGKFVVAKPAASTAPVAT